MKREIEVRNNGQPVSPLTEGRGLKLTITQGDCAWPESPLTEGRGLKRNTLAAGKAVRVRRPSRRGVD